MESMLSTLAFTLVIGGQFLAAVVLISRRNAIYGGLEDYEKAQPSPSEEIQTGSVEIPRPLLT